MHSCKLHAHSFVQDGMAATQVAAYDPYGWCPADDHEDHQTGEEELPYLGLEEEALVDRAIVEDQALILEHQLAETKQRAEQHDAFLQEHAALS